MIRPYERSRRIADAAAVLALLILPWLLYSGALGLWWSEDDFFQIGYALEHAPAEYFVDPEVWRRLPNRVLSPLLFASYELDLALFGPTTGAFYAHQILSISLAGVAIFLTLRLWLGPSRSFLAGVLLLLGPPVASLPPLLMVRHYPEALVLGALSVACFVLATRSTGRRAQGLAFLSALLYLAASLAKEIALPIPALLLALPGGDLRSRLRRIVPHAFAAAAYLGYRGWILGTLLGGYGWAVPSGEWPETLATLPIRVARELSGGSSWGWAAFLATACGLLVFGVRTRRGASLVAAGLLLAWLPLVPVAVEVAPRFALVSWTLLSVGFVVALSAGRARPPKPWPRLAIGLVVPLALLANRAAWDEQLSLAERKSVETRGLVGRTADDLLRRPASSPAAMIGLESFARRVLDRPVGGWFYDDLYLCRGRGIGTSPTSERIWQYDPGSRRLVDVTERIPSIRRTECSGLRRDVPLHVRLDPSEEGVLAWDLGPHEEGTYSFVLRGGRLRFDVPRRGAFHVGSRDRLTLRVRYASPGGPTTYSPPLSVGPPPGEIVSWSRDP